MIIVIIYGFEVYKFYHFNIGKIHPLDLKNGVAEAVDKLIEPIRKHFEKNKKAKKLLHTVKSTELTR